jgi:hypothetical protein
VQFDILSEDLRGRLELEKKEGKLILSLVGTGVG